MAMTEFEEKCIDRLGRIETMLESDFRALYGNGHPGLLDRVQCLEQEVNLLKNKSKWYKDWLGWIIATALGVAEILTKLK